MMMMMMMMATESIPYKDVIVHRDVDDLVHRLVHQIYRAVEDNLGVAV